MSDHKKNIKKRPFSISFKGTTSLTKQSFREECDMNNIISKFHRTGELPLNFSNVEAQYGVAPTQDLKEALDTIQNLKNEFNDLSEKDKERFEGSYVKYAEFLDEFENFDLDSYVDAQQPQELASEDGENPAPARPAEQNAPD
ncbi:internal scaffolding protein [Microviridae sp.]|nr:internal scaffolding protein [Microviridae sp.]